MYIKYIGTDYWLLTTDPGSQLAHQALIECAHPVLPAGDLLLRPTSLYICNIQIFILYIFVSAMCSLYISAILYIFQLYCRPISFSFLIHTSGNITVKLAQLIETTNWGKFSLTCASIAYQLHTAPLARLKNNHIDKVIQPLVIYLKHI